MGSAERAAKVLSQENVVLAELIHDISDASNRAAGLTRQLLAFSRKQVLAPRHLNVNELISQVANMLRRLVGAAVTLDLELVPDVGQVLADQSQLEQVLLNLAVNGRDAMPNGGRLIIATQLVELTQDDLPAQADAKPGSYVCIAVSDTGSGMEPEVLARAFEPFFTTKGPGEGTGMGLATVFGIVKQSEGHVAVSTSVGQGTTFRIYLPSAIQTNPTMEAGLPKNDSPRGVETILVVNDDDLVLRVAAAFLKDCGYTVLRALGGTAACEAVAEHPGPINLLLVDVVMPGMTGPEVAQRLSALRHGIKILFFSAHTDNADLLRNILGRNVHFLQKPFSRESLKKKVRQLLDASVKADAC